MKQMTIEDFQNLRFGDKVYRIAAHSMRSLRYVGRMPGSEDNYFIMCEGEFLTFFHKSHSLDGWYIGEYDKEFVGNVIVCLLEKESQKELGVVKKVYLGMQCFQVKCYDKDTKVDYDIKVWAKNIIEIDDYMELHYPKMFVKDVREVK